MMAMQTEIPEDVMKAAVVAFNEAIDIDGYEGSYEVIARAIMEEREKGQSHPIDTAPETGEFLAEYKTGDWFVAERYDNPFGMLNTVIDRRSGKWWSPSRWMPLPPKQEEGR